MMRDAMVIAGLLRSVRQSSLPFGAVEALADMVAHGGGTACEIGKRRRLREGVVYQKLNDLLAEGLATSSGERKKRKWMVTEEGQAQLRAVLVAAMEEVKAAVNGGEG
jgi:hypothetical protein